MGTNIDYNMNVQHQFFDHDLLEIGYVGNRGVHLSATNDANVPLIPGLEPFRPAGPSSLERHRLPDAEHVQSLRLAAGKIRASL